VAAGGSAAGAQVGRQHDSIGGALMSVKPCLSDGHTVARIASGTA